MIVNAIGRKFDGVPICYNPFCVEILGCRCSGLAAASKGAEPLL